MVVYDKKNDKEWLSSSLPVGRASLIADDDGKVLMLLCLCLSFYRFVSDAYVVVVVICCC
jgi:hypothetical protein